MNTQERLEKQINNAGSNPARYEITNMREYEERIIEQKSAYAVAKNMLKITSFIFPILFTMWLIAMLIPSKETFYLIAGSEAAEQVVTSEAGQLILDDVQSIIREQLKTLRPKQHDF